MIYLLIGLAKKRERCEITNKNNVSQKRVSLILAMNNKKIIKSKLCEQNVDGKTEVFV